MTDDSRPVDLLIIGGLTIDDLPGGVEATGGAARYATEGALADGLSVALHTAAGNEPVTRAGLDRLAARATVVLHLAPRTIRYELHESGEARRLRLRAATEPIEVPDPGRLPAATAVLFAPVAGEIATAALGRVSAPFRSAGLQGWLRETDADGWVRPRAPQELDVDLSAALRGLDLLIASHADLGAADGPSALAALRGWAGPGPELVVTAGTLGAWLDDGAAPPMLVAAEVIEAAETIGAGDAFAAVLVARRAAGASLPSAAAAASEATARYLANRSRPTAMSPMLTSLAELDGTSWQALRFGPGLSVTPPNDTRFTLTLLGERLAGKSGCNRYLGGWTDGAGGIGIGPLASTMMACPEPLMTLERQFLDAMATVVGARLDQDHLVLLAADGQLVVELSRSEEPA